MSFDLTYHFVNKLKLMDIFAVTLEISIMRNSIWELVWVLIWIPATTLSFFAENGEVFSDHYKLLPVDLRDIPKLNDIITLAGMDPRYAYLESVLLRSLSPIESLLSFGCNWEFEIRHQHLVVKCIKTKHIEPESCKIEKWF